MATNNPFSTYQISIPKKYADEIKMYCRHNNTELKNGEYVPFNRQVDFWYFCFLYAVKKGLDPEHIVPSELSHIIFASILEDYHIIHIQMWYLSKYEDISVLNNSRDMFNSVSDLANAGMPYVLSLLKDSEEGKPLFNILDEIEFCIK